MKKAIYAFSGDPITFGHIDIIRRATRVFDEVIVGIGVNPNKTYTFTLEQRTHMAEKSLAGISGVKVVAFDGLLVDYAFEHGIPVIIKGVRNARDFDYEVMLHHLSDSQKLDIDTYMLPAKQDLTHVSSSAAKALQQEHGLIHEYVPLYVKMCLEAKISGQYIVGITGEIGAGKSYVSEKINEIGEKNHIPVCHIELDYIGHQILGYLMEPLYRNVRDEIEKKFGKEVRCEDGSMDRKALGELVFNNPHKLEELNALLYMPLMVRLRRELFGKKGLILCNAALIAESNMAYLCNNNVILVTADRESQKRRLRERHLTTKQIQKRLQSQFNTEQKKEHILSQIESTSHGKMWLVDNSDNTDASEIQRLFDDIISTVDIYGELRFKSLWERLTCRTSYRDEYDRIVALYSEGTRYYHTLSHIVQGLQEFTEVKNLLKDPDAVECAWWFHDSIYRPLSSTNEYESAEYALSRLRNADIDEAFSLKVVTFVRNTDHSKPRETSTDMDFSDSMDLNVLQDIDLSILGRSEGEFYEYEKKIRYEFGMVNPSEYREKRRKFLEELLKRNTMYKTDFFRMRYEKQARKNIQNLLNER
jgi:pantetheine-phosphate adenylyltransferase